MRDSAGPASAPRNRTTSRRSPAAPSRAASRTNPKAASKTSTARGATNTPTGAGASNGRGGKGATNDSAANSAANGRAGKGVTDGRTAKSATNGRAAQSATNGRTAKGVTNGRTAKSATNGRTDTGVTDGRVSKSATNGRTDTGVADGRAGKSVTDGRAGKRATKASAANVAAVTPTTAAPCTATSSGTKGATNVAAGVGASERLTADARREALLDVARALVLEGGSDAVNMGVVAERAGVTRPLVYKHFDNKDALLLALYRREVSRLSRYIRTEVDAAPAGFESKVRAFVASSLDSVAGSAPFFAPLQAASANPDVRSARHARDRRTVTYFADLAVAEFGVDERAARTVISVLFSGIWTLISQMRSRPSAAQRLFLLDTCVAMSVGAFEPLSP